MATLATTLVIPAAEVLPPPTTRARAPAVPHPMITGPSISEAKGVEGMLSLGAGSCATGSCHGGPKSGNHDVQSFAATIWTNDDPHATASQTLHSPRSRRMAALLGLRAAHEAETCLACHTVQASTTKPLPPAVLADGVACGSCHGDASGWIALHTQADWRSLPPDRKASQGFRDLGDVTARVRTCIPCHVGDETREVGHRLLAAGHPRLSFEFAAYQRLSPRHWSPTDNAENQPDFSERSWAVGQAETIAAAAHLLAVRAARARDEQTPAVEPAAGHRATWPELAEFDCYACHRALSPDRIGIDSAGPYRNPFPGTPAWQPWTASAARLLSACIDPPADGVGAATDAVASSLRPGWAAADMERLSTLVASANTLTDAARQASDRIGARPRVVLDGSIERLDGLSDADPPEWRFWDAAVQSILMLEASREGGAARPGVWPAPGRVTPSTPSRDALDQLRRSLRFPEAAGGPDGFDPGAFRAELQRLP